MGGDTYGYFPGLIDEVRKSSVARSAAWVKAEYAAGRGTLATISEVPSTDTNVVSGTVRDASTSAGVEGVLRC